jgi:transforming growth factor-beta-induced protein
MYSVAEVDLSDLPPDFTLDQARSVLEIVVSGIRLKGGVLRLDTLQGGFIALTPAGNTIYITDELRKLSKVVETNMEAENGVVHGIDTLLLPQ